jgi:hypothetical protein
LKTRASDQGQAQVDVAASASLPRQFLGSQLAGPRRASSFSSMRFMRVSRVQEIEEFATLRDGLREATPLGPSARNGRSLSRGSGAGAKVEAQRALDQHRKQLRRSIVLRGASPSQREAIESGLGGAQITLEQLPAD